MGTRHAGAGDATPDRPGGRRHVNGDAGGTRKARQAVALAGAPAATKFLSLRGKECMMIAPDRRGE